jgi:stage II sporulation protein P
VESWLARYPGIGVVIDLHRDAVGADQVVYKTLARVAGGSAAQVMLVVGTGENGLDHPLWRDNLALALAIHRSAEDSGQALVRPIQLVKERYNQHLSPGAFILEVGANGNTLSEAERAAELFARSAGPIFLSLVTD